jgi:hypothetical protein
MILRKFSINCPLAISQEITSLDPLVVARCLYKLSKCPDFSLVSVFSEKWFIEIKQYIRTKHGLFHGNHLSACVYYMASFKHFPSEEWHIYEMRFARTHIWEEMSFVSILKTLEGFACLPNDTAIARDEVFEKAEVEIMKRLREFMNGLREDVARIEDIAMCIELYTRMQCGSQELYELLFKLAIYLCNSLERVEASSVITMMWCLKMMSRKDYKLEYLMKFVRENELGERDLAYLNWIRSYKSKT